MPVLKEIDDDRLLLVLEYLVAGKDVKEEEIELIIEEIGGKDMPSLAQKWLKQGIEQGIEQGLQQGMVRDAQEMVLEAIEVKFGNVPQVLKDKIISLSDRSILKNLLSLIMQAGDIKEVEKGLIN